MIVQLKRCILLRFPGQISEEERPAYTECPERPAEKHWLASTFRELSEAEGGGAEECKGKNAWNLHWTRKSSCPQSPTVSSSFPKLWVTCPKVCVFSSGHRLMVAFFVSKRKTSRSKLLQNKSQIVAKINVTFLFF